MMAVTRLVMADTDMVFQELHLFDAEHAFLPVNP
jgi:hypothetical protein